MNTAEHAAGPVVIVRRPRHMTARTAGFIRWLVAVVAAFGVGGAAVGQCAGMSSTRTIQTYRVPDVSLLNQNGLRVSLSDIVDAGKPTVLQFIYTRCRSVTPVLSAVFASVQEQLGERAGEVALVSVSIDPAYDTPEVMRDHLDTYGADPGWEFLTGDPQDVALVMQAFDVFLDDAGNHDPLILVKTQGEGRWIRFGGFISLKGLLTEVRDELGR